MTGYDLADEMFDKIGQGDLSSNDIIRIIQFFGYNEEADKTTKIGFVCCYAREKIKEAIEQALINGNYELFEEIAYQIQIRKPLDKEFFSRNEYSKEFIEHFGLEKIYFKGE